MLIDITGSPAEIVSDEDRMRPAGSEVGRLLCDNTRAREWAGWEPKVPLEQGLRMTSDWIRDHLDELDTSGYAV